MNHSNLQGIVSTNQKKICVDWSADVYESVHHRIWCNDSSFFAWSLGMLLIVSTHTLKVILWKSVMLLW